ncbi:uncharacterized protein EV420DRAFT_587356 [Desarmillaria tabescens]|uniref:Uncharacterized protein n=1 Tax=Armillaria tabescens TaxID=1929756 RepID=A0AA39K8E2_ARMTA|nr:uncharacterized protein EV420DRAFT_587356 [Desarmillaria tabescens]KAK0455186.1 hypothetical protein EV420DRAFT_587356 [Desarmillaria tabescens]
MSPTIYHRAPLTDSLARHGILGDVLEKRGTPKIGGSVGGFIALVVGLSLIILISCIAIFFLLREGEPSDEERAARRRRYRQQALEYTYGPTASPQSSWSSKVKSVFGGTTSSSKGSKRGWVQAGSGDEWESESIIDEAEGRHPDLSQRGSMQITYSPPLDAPFHPPLQPSESASSVRFDTQGVPVLPYLRSLSSPSPHPSLPNIHSRISSPTPSDPLSPVHDRVVSPEPIAPAHIDSPVEHHEGRKSSGQSATSVRTFNGGTKFLEAL